MTVRNRNRRWYLQAGLFAGMLMLLCAPLCAWLLRVPELPVQEMRSLAQWPRWYAMPVSELPSAFEAWVNDHFPLRSRVVQWQGIVWRRWLREPSKLVVVGRDDWLFYVGENTVNDLEGRDRFTEAELVAWLEAVEGRRAWWRERGADYLLVFVPNKSTIYPEKLPWFMRSRVVPGKLEQLTKFFVAQDCSARFLDLGVILRAEKARTTVYWPTDSHWSGEGLMAGCEAIMNELKLMGVPHRIRDEDKWMQVERVLREGDCVGLLGMSGRWPLVPVSQVRMRPPPDFSEVTTPISKLPLWRPVSSWARPIAFERESGIGRALLVCDSFFRGGGLVANAQSPLILNFRRFLAVCQWHGRNLATHDVLAVIADVERPTIVIEQWTERFLRTPPPDHPEFQRARAAAIDARRAMSPQ